MVRAFPRSRTNLQQAFGEIVVLYQRQVVKAIMSMLKMLVACDDESFWRVFKALLHLEKDSKKRVIEHINKVSTVRKCSFKSVASDILSAKISGLVPSKGSAQGLLCWSWSGF